MACQVGYCAIASLAIIGYCSSRLNRMQGMAAAATNRIREWRHARGVSLERLAELAGVSPSYLNRMETGERNVSIKRLSPIAAALDVHMSQLVTVDNVPLVGWIGDGGRVEFLDERQVDGKAIALEIRGNALGAIFDGWNALFDNVRDAPSDALLDCVCVVGLADGHVLVRQLQRGQIAGCYNLRSSTEPPIYDALVAWAARIKELTPRRR